MRLALLVAVLFAWSSHAAEPVYSELDAGWKADLAAKRLRVTQLVRKQYGYTLKATAEDLAIIQRVIDDDLLPKTDIVGYQALGVVFGDASKKDLNAEWMQVEDEYGLNPVLKIKRKRAAIGALTIILKRMEDTGHVDVIALHDNLIRDVQRLRMEFGQDK